MLRLNDRKNKNCMLVTCLALFFTLILFYYTSIFLNTNINAEESLIETLPNPLPVDADRNDYGQYEDEAKRLPQAIIIGSRKSGTRALLKFLEVNPSIRSARKEIHFFDKPENYKQGIEWYRKQMPKSKASDVTIEKSPSYFVTPGVPELVKAMNASIKLVLILRDPVIRLISDYSQLIANKIEQSDDKDTRDYATSLGNSFDYGCSSDNLTVESIWAAAEKSFKKYILRPDGGIDDQRRAVKIGMYSIYLERWLAQFHLAQIYIVDGEALITNPYSEMIKLEIFLGLESKIEPDNFVFNPKKGFYCLARNKFARCNITQEESQSKQTESKIVQQDEIGLECLSRSKGRRHVAVRKDLVDKLRTFYAPYNQFLQSLTGKKFNWS